MPENSQRRLKSKPAIYSTFIIINNPRAYIAHTKMLLAQQYGLKRQPPYGSVLNAKK